MAVVGGPTSVFLFAAVGREERTRLLEIEGFRANRMSTDTPSGAIPAVDGATTASIESVMVWSSSSTTKSGALTPP